MDSELIEKASEKAKSGDYEEALRLYREAGGAEGTYGEGACLYRLGSEEDARSALNRCLKLDPSHEKAGILLRRISPKQPVQSKWRLDWNQPLNWRHWLIFIGLAVIAFPIIRSVISERSNAPRRQVSSVASPIQYRVLNEEVYDAPIKTQVELSILVSGEVSKASLRQLLNDLFGKLANRTGFKHHPKPTHLFIRAYLTEQHYRSGMGQWVAQSLRIGDSEPEFHINDRQMSQIGRAPEERFGLTEAKRKAIYYELVEAEDRANQEAAAKYPDIDPLSPAFSAKISMEQLEKQYDYAGQLTEIYTKQVAEKHKMTSDQMRGISQEGLTKDWPMPE